MIITTGRQVLPRASHKYGDPCFQLEINDPKEVVEECLYDEIHPKKNVARQQFARPKGPAGRGPKRMTKATNGEPDE